jgi:hypothetical protein
MISLCYSARTCRMGIEAGGGGKGGNPDVPKPPQHNQSSEGRLHNIDPSTLRAASEQRRFGSGLKKPEGQGAQGTERPIFEKPLISEAQRLANERWRAINKRMERYTQEQEGKIHDMYFDKLTARFKPQDFMPENLTPERRMEAAAMFEECMELVNQTDQDTFGNSSNTPSK